MSVLHVYSTGRGRIPGTGCIERVVSCHAGAGSAQPSLQPLPSLFVPINLLSCNYRAVIRIGIGSLNLVMQTRIALMIIAFFLSFLDLEFAWSLHPCDTNKIDSGYILLNLLVFMFEPEYSPYSVLPSLVM